MRPERNHLIAAFVSIFTLILFPAVVSAQGSWTNPDARVEQPGPANDDALQKLINELRGQIDNAERKGSAHPRFLQNLRDLADRYQRPPRVEVLHDDFKDGNFNARPHWTVTAGDFYIENGYGLRSTVSSLPGQSSEPPRSKDTATAILGIILKKAFKEKRSTQQANTDAVASIHVAAKIPNAFSMRLILYSTRSPAILEMGPYQGAQRSRGYRLVYRSGDGVQSLQLIRVSPRGSGVVETSTRPVLLEDQRPHEILWTRSRGGDMVVSIDGDEKIRTIDRGLRNAFDGFQMINRGGDHILKSISVSGAG